jgi:lipoprotein-anchoring transpeptidase ErfK/SrfK
LWLNHAVRLKTQRRNAARRARLLTRFAWLVVLVGVLIVVVGLLWRRSAREAGRQPPPRAPSPAPAPATNLPRASVPPVSPFSPRVLEAQIALVRQGFSPGSLDGVPGSQTRAALRAFQRKEGLPSTGEPDAATLARLGLDAPALTTYTVTSDDLARLRPLGRTWLAKSGQDRLDYETILELVAEKSQAHPRLIERLNPAVDWTNVPPGLAVTVPNAALPPVTEKAAFVKILLAARTLQAFGAASNLLAHFPCSIAQRVDKRPLGEVLRVTVVIADPNYTFDPAVFPESAEGRQLGRRLIIPPGPNNPVGVAWIGLDKRGYGIHGTPRPEDVGRTESHGCFRLANWNAAHLLNLVWVGMPVHVEP